MSALVIRRTCAAVLVLSAFALPQLALGQSVSRGPYLQMGTDTSMVVRWRTNSSTDSVVRYGLSQGSLNEIETIAGSGTEHTVTLPGLFPDTRYYYSVGNTAGPLAGDDSDHVFRTSPVPGVSRPTRIWIVGDSGTGNANAQAVRDAYLNETGVEETHLFIMLGDNAYSSGTDNQYQTAMFDMYPETLKQTPVWPTLGNHDGFSANSSTQSGPYYDIFNVPTVAEAGGLPSGTEAYYSFDYGNAHFICLESYETDRSREGAMMTWLLEDLAATDKEWIIAFWHHPPYTRGSHNSDNEGELIDMRQNAVPILEDYGVDLVFTGHSHSYERSFLIDGHYGNEASFTESMKVNGGDGRVDGTGAYDKIGGPGAPHGGAVYTVAGSSGQTSGGPLNHDAMFISLNELGSVVLEIDGSQIDATFLTDTGSTDDYFTLTKGPDLIAPALVAAEATSATHVLVTFSERVDLTSATNTANFSLDMASVLSAALLADSVTVELTTSALPIGVESTLTVSNVQDRAGNSIAPGSQAAITYLATSTVSFQNGALPDAGYSGTRDTYINQDKQDTNYGSSTILLIDGDDGGGDDLATLIAWDLTGIPTGSTVQSVSVTLQIFDPTPGPYTFFEVKRDWIELEATWNEYVNGSNWQTSGGQGANDRDSTPLGAISGGGTGSRTYELNPAGVALVQAWLDGTRPNYGLMIANSSTSDGADFHSSENATASNRPMLTVTVGLPPPSDSDGDGIPDVSDNCIDDHNPDQTDTDNDTVGDACDDDDDNDTVLDGTDNCPLIANTDQTDTDNDQAGDACDTDDDNDAVDDTIDNCPLASNPNQSDFDSDELGDVCDNCIEVDNPDQYDSNGDGIGSICDTDLDNNNIVNFLDLDQMRNAFFGTPVSPNWNPDADFDNSGVVNFVDLELMKMQFFGPPGPSGVAP